MSATPRETFGKSDPRAPAGFFEREAEGLAWLGEATAHGGVPVAEVLDVGPGFLNLVRLTRTRPDAQSADELGRRLARTHALGTDCWGRRDGDGFIGPLPLPNGPFSDWPTLWWEGRVEPYLRAAQQAGTLIDGDARLMERAVSQAAPHVPETDRPARIHGDLWSGNVLWTPEGAVLIDAAAAHGGHRESDLAMLELFGLPMLDVALAAYDEASPLAPGWRERIPLHQLHPVLVHAVLFGGGYVQQARRLAARVLAEH